MYIWRKTLDPNPHASNISWAVVDSIIQDCAAWRAGAVLYAGLLHGIDDAAERGLTWTMSGSQIIEHGTETRYEAWSYISRQVAGNNIPCDRKYSDDYMMSR